MLCAPTSAWMNRVKYVIYFCFCSVLCVFNIIFRDHGSLSLGLILKTIVKRTMVNSRIPPGSSVAVPVSPTLTLWSLKDLCCHMWPKQFQDSRTIKKNFCTPENHSVFCPLPSVPNLLLSESSTWIIGLILDWRFISGLCHKDIFNLRVVWGFYQACRV